MGGTDGGNLFDKVKEECDDRYVDHDEFAEFKEFIENSNLNIASECLGKTAALSREFTETTDTIEKNRARI